MLYKLQTGKAYGSTPMDILSPSGFAFLGHGGEHQNEFATPGSSSVFWRRGEREKERERERESAGEGTNRWSTILNLWGTFSTLPLDDSTLYFLGVPTCVKAGSGMHLEMPPGLLPMHVCHQVCQLDGDQPRDFKPFSVCLLGFRKLPERFNVQLHDGKVPGQIYTFSCEN